MKTAVADMIMKLGRKLAETAREKTRSSKESPTLRAEGHENAFTRDRKLTAERIVSMILTPAKQSLQKRLKEFGAKFMREVF